MGADNTFGETNFNPKQMKDEDRELAEKEDQMEDKPFLTEEIEKVFGGLRDAIEDEDLAEWYLSVVNTFTENQLSVVKAEISRLHEKIKLLEDQLQWAKEKGKSEF